MDSSLLRMNPASPSRSRGPRCPALVNMELSVSSVANHANSIPCPAPDCATAPAFVSGQKFAASAQRRRFERAQLQLCRKQSQRCSALAAEGRSSSIENDSPLKVTPFAQRPNAATTSGFVSGHEFTRAERAHKESRALAPVLFFDYPRNSIGEPVSCVRLVVNHAV